MIAIAVAGGLGAAARLLADGLVTSRASARFPWGTVLINVVGSFLLGLVVAVGPPAHQAIGTGLLGGFTTFSTASVETARLVLDRRHVAALLNGFGVLVLAVGAASAGYGLGHL